MTDPKRVSPGRRSATTTVAAVLLGSATGLRSQMGTAAVVLGTSPSALPATLRHRAVRIVASSAAAGELVADKLPNTPDRTAPVGLAAQGPVRIDRMRHRRLGDR